MIGKAVRAKEGTEEQRAVRDPDDTSNFFILPSSLYLFIYSNYNCGSLGKASPTISVQP